MTGCKTTDMDGKELMNITVRIAERSYPLKVKEEDVEQIRGIVEEINSKVNTFQKTYSRKDKQDCLSMALLTYAVDLHKKSPSSSSDQQVAYSEVSKKVDKLDELLDFLLQ